jgi:hypothetical protein
MDWVNSMLISLFFVFRVTRVEKYLLEKGADPVVRTVVTKKTALEIAVEMKHDACRDLLLAVFDGGEGADHVGVVSLLQRMSSIENK